MNSPDTPGQNISGKNAASVVEVEATIGQNMRFTASLIGATTVQAFGHFAIGKLHHHDGAVNQHTQAQQQAER